MTQISSDNLRTLLGSYEAIVSNLNEAITKATVANNTLAEAKADVAKCTHQMNLIKEQIMCEKTLIKATQ